MREFDRRPNHFPFAGRIDYFAVREGQAYPPKMALMNLLFESIGGCRFQFHLSTPAYVMSSEFTRKE